MNWRHSYPMIDKLNKYNAKLIKNTHIGNYNRLFSSAKKNEELLRNLNPNASEEQIQEWLAYETNLQNFLREEILKKPDEVRARLFTWLGKLKRLGYDTEHATSNDLIKWTSNELKKGTDIPYDVSHIFAVFANIVEIY